MYVDDDAESLGQEMKSLGKYSSVPNQLSPPPTYTVDYVQQAADREYSVWTAK